MELVLVAFNFPNISLCSPKTTYKHKQTNQRNATQRNRFLRGACDKTPCLLSHDTTLSKMPTCRFYLRGMCFKADCPYLHKKVNDKTEICVDFLRGFCEKADQVRYILFDFPCRFRLKSIPLILYSISLAFICQPFVYCFFISCQSSI